jgi:peptidoglycan hydrolase-like protein with peptidoglycan-binding domain
MGGTMEKIDVILEGGTPAPPVAPKPPAPVKEVDSVMTKLPVVNLKCVKASSSTWVRGESVKSVQGLLVARGYAPANSIRNGKLDGIGGPGTRAAVIAFQKASRIAVDGIVGEDTWKKLLKV